MAKAAPIEVTVNWKIEPGDKVLVARSEPMTLEEAQVMRGRLNERFPGVEFTFIHANDIAVMKGHRDD